MRGRRYACTWLPRIGHRRSISISGSTGHRQYGARAAHHRRAFVSPAGGSQESDGISKRPVRRSRKTYHDRGFATVFVDIPPQTIEDGLVRLRVTEGRVERTVIGGGRYFPERDIITSLPSTTPGTVLQISKLQTELAAVNSATPDRCGGAHPQGRIWTPVRWIWPCRSMIICRCTAASS
ncbi:MAG: POTRA domain-containing protein [Steroidobacteraceae bacterium]